MKFIFVSRIIYFYLVSVIKHQFRSLHLLARFYCHISKQLQKKASKKNLKIFWIQVWLDFHYFLYFLKVKLINRNTEETSIHKIWNFVLFSIKDVSHRRKFSLLSVASEIETQDFSCEYTYSLDFIVILHSKRRQLSKLVWVENLIILKANWSC